MQPDPRSWRRAFVVRHALGNDRRLRSRRLGRILVPPHGRADSLPSHRCSWVESHNTLTPSSLSASSSIRCKIRRPLRDQRGLIPRKTSGVFWSSEDQSCQELARHLFCDLRPDSSIQSFGVRSYSSSACLLFHPHVAALPS